jgi:hypothetical protein
MNKIIYLDRFDNVICWGDYYGCENYIKQLHSITNDSLHYEEYNIDSGYSYLYEDYEVVQIRGLGLFLTVGQVELMKHAYSDELRGLNSIRQELDNLLKMDDVFDSDMLDNIYEITKYMENVYKAFVQYNSHNLFENLDIDSLHQMQFTDRENKGLPTMYLK